VGAAGYGLPCVFLSAGIHAGELHRPDGGLDEGLLVGFLKAQAHRPMGVMRELRW
jgi:hypothetical protein